MLLLLNPATGEALTAACDTCRHRTGLMSCAAYPDGIPTAIAGGDDDHLQPRPGDGGVIYAPAWPSGSLLALAEAVTA